MYERIENIIKGELMTFKKKRRIEYAVLGAMEGNIATLKNNHTPMDTNQIILNTIQMTIEKLREEKELR
jgi:hypothetical protein